MPHKLGTTIDETSSGGRLFNCYKSLILMYNELIGKDRFFFGAHSPPIKLIYDFLICTTICPAVYGISGRKVK